MVALTAIDLCDGDLYSTKLYWFMNSADQHLIGYKKKSIVPHFAKFDLFCESFLVFYLYGERSRFWENI
jgi:hypothetical protein